MFKILSTYSLNIYIYIYIYIYILFNIWGGGSSTPVLYIGRTVLKG